MPNKNYRIPPPIVSQANYDKAVDLVKNASPADAAAVKAVGDALGVTVDPAKVTKLIAGNAATKLSDDQIHEGLYNSIAENDYNSVILSLLKKYCPPGLMGLALTALLASFMSGMAGNVTAFNTIWTYDLYQAYFAPNKSDAHYFWMGKFITVVGILISICCAYVAKQYNNAMDIIQLVFGFVNAPVFATFLLGMFWKRTTGVAAFIGLFSGIAASTVFHALTTTTGNVDAAGHVINHMKGGYLGVVSQIPQRNGPELLAGHLRLCRLLPRHRVPLAGDAAHQDRRAIERPRLFAHAQNRGSQPALVSAPANRRHGADHCVHHFEHHFLVNQKNKRN